MRAVSTFSTIIQRIYLNIESCLPQVSKSIQEESLSSFRVLGIQLITGSKTEWSLLIHARMSWKKIRRRGNTEICQWVFRNSEKWLKESSMLHRNLFRSLTHTIITDFKEGMKQSRSLRRLLHQWVLTECSRETTWCSIWTRDITWIPNLNPQLLTD